MKRKQLPQNLLSEAWTDLNSDELRLLLGERFGPGLGQYDGDNCPSSEYLRQKAA